MATIVDRQLMTASELERLPDDDMRYELVRGELKTMPPPGHEHAYLASRLSRHLGNYVEPLGLGEVGVEGGFYLQRNPDTVRAPDVYFIRQECVPTADQRRGFIEGAPDLAIEIVSPGDTVEEVNDKIQDYLSHGTRLVLILQPKTRTIAVHRLDGSVTHLRTSAGDVVDGEDVVPGFKLPLAQLFSYGS